MAITFDGSDNISNIYRYDLSAVTCYGIAKDVATQQSVFDYFDNNATVGDYITFGFGGGVWHNLSINVGTALVADAITVVWEFWNTDGTWDTLTCTDSSNGFRNAGAQTVTFSVPNNWLMTYPSVTLGGLGGFNYHYTACYIRCRITAVTNITEGGANSTNVPSCLDWTIKLTGANNYLLSDILAADVAGGWGVVSNTGSYYQIPANLSLGDGTNAINLTLRSSVMLELGSSTRYSVFMKKANSTLQLGYISGSTYSEGSYFKYWNHAGVFNDINNGYNTWVGTLKMYNSTFIKRSGGFNDPAINCVCDIQNSHLGGNYFFITGSTGSLINSSGDMGGTTNTYWFYDYSASLVISNLTLTNSYGVRVGSTNVTVSNINLGTALVFGTANANVIAYAKDFTFANISNQTQTAAAGDKVIVQFTLTLTVQDSAGTALSGVNVKIVNGLGTTISNATWTGSTVLTAFERRNTAPDTGTTDYSPFTVTISKSGYVTKTIKYTMDRKREEVETLEKQIPTFNVINGDNVKQVLNAYPTSPQNSVLLDVIEEGEIVI